MGLRTNSAAICVVLLVQYGLGMGVNLYAQVPPADQGTRLAVAVGRALTSQPVVLAAHTALGLLMLVAGITVLVRAIRARHHKAMATSALGLAVIIGAAFSGATFVSKGQAGAFQCTPRCSSVREFAAIAPRGPSPGHRDPDPPVVRA